MTTKNRVNITLTRKEFVRLVGYKDQLTACREQLKQARSESKELRNRLASAEKKVRLYGNIVRANAKGRTT